MTSKKAILQEAFAGIQRRSAEQSEVLSRLFLTLGQALVHADSSRWDDVKLLLAQAEDLEEIALGDSAVTSSAWEKLGFAPHEGLNGQPLTRAS